MNEEIDIIWRKFQKELSAFVISKVGNKQDADDILQNAFIKIINKQEQVFAANDIRQYIYKIVRNATMDHFRSNTAKQVELEKIMTLSEQESDSLNQTIAHHCIKPFIEKLPAKYKEALLITEFSDVSQVELAKQLNLSHSGAKSRVQRGRDKLKKIILDCCNLESDAYGNLSSDDLNSNCDC